MTSTPVGESRALALVTQVTGQREERPELPSVVAAQTACAGPGTCQALSSPSTTSTYSTSTGSSCSSGLEPQPFPLDQMLCASSWETWTNIYSLQIERMADT